MVTRVACVISNLTVEFQASYMSFCLFVWLILMWWKNLCKCVPLYEKWPKEKVGLLGVSVGDACLPVHFSWPPAALV